MTQHGTSVVIKQTNDGLGSAELRLLEMLQVVARDQKNQEREAETSSIHSIFRTGYTVQDLWGLSLSQHALGYQMKTEKHMHTYGELNSFLHLTWMSLDCGKKVEHW